MRKLNFGCGLKVAPGWDNIDFHSNRPEVKRVNLLNGFPYPDNHFDVVYSSHVIEHFTRDDARFLLKEAYRTLKPNGILRIVVPDLAVTCREYIRILELPDDDIPKLHLHEWISIELLDQLVRTRHTGEMGAFFQKMRNGDFRDISDYVQSRTQYASYSPPIGEKSFIDKLRGVNLQKLSTKLDYFYVRLVTKLLPRGLRELVFDGTGIGERHKWMYDYFSLTRLCESAGFVDCKSLPYNESQIPQFSRDCLDSNNDGSVYKKTRFMLKE
ncbi:class I SAM-dependent methyltransferase [Methylomonas sp. CM2]|uniref:class I SAM-dependent methyltransferase n=1 Tax=Methylomonas sp. CM2 TaxID=3417647 RepID=UPI003CE6F7CF